MNKIYFLLILCLPSFLHGNNWYVSTSSSGNGSGDSWNNKKKYTSFNWASVQPGDTVYLDGGIDSLVYNINQYEIDTHGSVTSPITITKGIDAGHNGKAVFLNTSPDYIGMTLSDISNTIFYNLEWKGGMAATGETWLLDFDGTVTNVTFLYCTFILNYSCGIGTNTGASSDNITFDHCNSYNNLDTHTNSSADQFWLGGGGHKNWRFTYCNIINSNPKTGATTNSAHRDLMQCEFQWGKGGTFTIDHCFFDDRSAGVAGACIESEHLRGDWFIYDNIFKSNSTGANNTGYFNLLSLTADPASSTRNLTIYNNTFIGTTNDVRAVFACLWKSLHYKNNITYFPNGGYYVLTISDDIVNGTMEIDYNQYYKTGTYNGFTEELNGNTTWTWNQWLNNLGNDLHSTFNTNIPDFVNYGGFNGGDYALAGGSEGIDDGTPVTLVQDDYLGTARPQGTTYDLGAFEYLNGVSNYVILKSKVFLQGPFNSNLMTTTLNQSSLLPNSQPYNSAPWNYSGTENLGSGPSSTMVDWVLVELRSSSDPTVVVARRAAMLKNNGRLLETNGINEVTFNNVETGSYYIAIYHRNHLAVMSAESVPLTTNSDLYDFTTAMDKAYGQNPMVELAPGLYGMYAADGNADGVVNDQDREGVWLTQNGNMGYLEGDFNMDSGVTIHDVNQLWNFNNGKMTQVP